jgi:signal transduction histidine kinase
VKYSREARDIDVALEREGDLAVVTVADHGVGIPKDEQAKIFDRFHRVSTGLVHDVKGSGLGLAIVRHIAEAHGGGSRSTAAPGREPLPSPAAVRETVPNRDAAPGAAASGRVRRPSEA